jgi:nucleotide-binding universal stress UspA family protein
MAAPVTPHTQSNIRKVAVLTDFSENAEVALRFAAKIARGVRAKIVLAHAQTPPSCIFSAPEVKLVYDALAHWREGLRLSLLNQTKATYLRDIECTVLVHEGTPKELLEDLRDADLIVVGTSGKTGLQKLSLGSTAEEIFRSSPVPVLTVGPHCGCSETEGLMITTLLFATDFSPDATRL